MYGLSLADVERNYGCYAEYARSMEDDAAHEAEVAKKHQSYYQKNKALLKEAEAAGQRIDFAPDCCKSCPNYTDIGPTFGSDWDIDDWEHARCSNPKCQTFIEHNRRRYGE